MKYLSPKKFIILLRSIDKLNLQGDSFFNFG